MNTNVDTKTGTPTCCNVLLAPVRVLNLYACLGGNRLLWENCEVTAVELDTELARLYKERFPNDNVIVADAHQYLLDHYKEFDFIWSSPPCPSHSRARYWSSSNYETTTEAIYPDMKLYEEILFLQHYYRTGKYVVENVIPYYEPLIPAKKRGRHLYWTNFNLPSDLGDRRIQIGAVTDELKRLCEFHKIDISTYKGEQSMIKVARNLVDFEAGKTIYNTAMNILQASTTKQNSLFGDGF
ncbi:DNA cytosine methyltransferase [Flavobacterium psychrophilum]|uniref:DNA cytosine methyltransferase n=1 Tax=Flavobacterium psychrophilum TaxID=96345 RepID=UPI001D05CDAB|nr:DNA cytosine methyltransferase [Flavobacterium psychrophilum]MCB6099581.1 class I SAM-dependent methyltransferase [Flavobacterium psychrophilum]